MTNRRLAGGSQGAKAPAQPAPRAGTEQPEVDDRHDSLVVEGEDSGHVLPPTELDPYTPEPHAPKMARRAMALALVVIVCILLVVGIYAAVH